MTEQDYKEKTAALKESGIPLDMQKDFQRMLDKEFSKKESCTGATETRKE